MCAVVCAAPSSSISFAWVRLNLHTPKWCVLKGVVIFWKTSDDQGWNKVLKKNAVNISGKVLPHWCLTSYMFTSTFLIDHSTKCIWFPNDVYALIHIQPTSASGRPSHASGQLFFCCSPFWFVSLAQIWTCWLEQHNLRLNHKNTDESTLSI